MRLDARLRRLEKAKPTDLQALSDAELDARIQDCMSRLLAFYGTIDALIEDSEPALAALIRQHREAFPDAHHA